MKKTFAFITGLFIILALAGLSLAQPCMVSPSFNMPLMPDSDCDGFIDPIDNCAFITNPGQQDIDNNGLGDACDTYIESVRTNPSDFVYDGRNFNTIVTVMNNRDYNIQNMRVRVFLPELGIESIQYIDNINTCQSRSMEFSLRAPVCAPEGEYQIVVEASYQNHIQFEERISAITSIRIVPDQYCMKQLTSNGMTGKTFIDVMELKDVYKGVDTVFPIQITNTEGSAKEYEISVTGTEGWASYRLNPGSVIIVPDNTQRVADLYIKTRNDIPPGERVFVVTVKNGEEMQRFTLVAQVKENSTFDMSAVWFYSAKIIFIILLLVLLLAAIIIGIAKYFTRAKQESNAEYY